MSCKLSDSVINQCTCVSFQPVAAVFRSLPCWVTTQSPFYAFRKHLAPCTSSVYSIKTVQLNKTNTVCTEKALPTDKLHGHWLSWGLCDNRNCKFSSIGTRKVAHSHEGLIYESSHANHLRWYQNRRITRIGGGLKNHLIVL